MTNPKSGDEAECRYCGEKILYVACGQFGAWKHWPGPQASDGRHEAEPAESSKTRGKR